MMDCEGDLVFKAQTQQVSTLPAERHRPAMTVQILFMMRSFAACHVADQKFIIHTVTLLHYLALFHGMTTLILEIYCVACREQRFHGQLWPAKTGQMLHGLASSLFTTSTPKLYVAGVMLILDRTQRS